MSAVLDNSNDLIRANNARIVELAKPLPSELEPVEAFPLAALPDAFRPFVSDVADRMQCVPDFVAVPLLVSAASIVARTVRIRPQGLTDWSETPNLWALVVGSSATMKSPTMREALAALQWLEARASDRHSLEMEDFAVKAATQKLRAEVGEKNARKALEKNGEADVSEHFKQRQEAAPPRPRYIVNDLTYEKLGEILSQNPGGLLSVRDELRGLLSQLAREENAPARALYLQAWSGGPYTFDRIGRGTQAIADARLSMVGGIQPGPLASFIRSTTQGGAMDDGLLQRFLICWPDQPTQWRNVDRSPDAQARRRVFDVFRRLDEMRSEDVGAEWDDDANREGLGFVRFAPEALALFETWRTELEARLREEGMTPALASALSKFRKHVPALALTLHVVDGGSGPVNVRAASRALALGEYFESHARRAYSSGLRPTVAAAKAILRKLRSGSLDRAGFTHREVYRQQWEGLADPEVVESALGVLVTHGYLSESQTLSGPSGGRPTFVYAAIEGAWQ